MDDNNYQVIITNSIGTDQDTETVIAKLAALFKIDTAKAARIMQQSRTVIKDNLDEATAKKYCLAIQKTGAHCELIDKSAEPLPELSIPDQPRPDIEPKPFIQTARKSADKQQSLSLEARDEQSLKNLDQFTAQGFCAECGTIKESADSICIHCGLRDDLANQTKTTIKKALLASVAAAVLFVILGFALKPFYLQYTQKTKIQDGLQLAIETRNRVTTFILDTNFWPNQNIDAGLPKSIQNEIIESIKVSENAVITVIIRAEALGSSQSQDLIFTPRLFKDKITWNCLKGSLSNKFRPDACKVPE
ncbi:MAG: pilin [Gammaproteobacteria bacterium]|nr:pilin [Gammaproteobacteria bacterium]